MASRLSDDGARRAAKPLLGAVMELWMALPWWLRMIVSVTIIGLGVALMWWAVTSGPSPYGSRGRLVVPGLVLLLGLAAFATSFPYDNTKYKF